MSRTTIFILYNAKASVLGKVEYAYRKISAPANSSPCAACDLTHGGLRLSESDLWRDTQRRINAHVEQLHHDQLSPELIDFVKANNIRYPAILGQVSEGPLKLLIDGVSLGSVSKDHEAFLSLLVASAEREAIPLSVHEKGYTPGVL